MWHPLWPHVERSGDRGTAEYEEPRLSFCVQAPRCAWRQIDPFEHEVGGGDEKRPLIGEPARWRPNRGRSGICYGDCAAIWPRPHLLRKSTNLLKCNDLDAMVQQAETLLRCRETSFRASTGLRYPACSAIGEK